MPRVSQLISRFGAVEFQATRVVSFAKFLRFGYEVR
jgi:hypothetical protein